MKTLFLTVLLSLSFSAFADYGQKHDVNCESLAESNERSGKQLSADSKSKTEAKTTSKIK